jgi:energy-coupling factor transport system permease protein
MIYRRRASPLHAARPAAATAWCASLGALALLYDHPLVLAAVLVAAVAGGVAAGVGPALARAARFAIPLGILIALVNPLVDHNGLTVLIRGDDVPLLPGGRTDVTLEAVAYGGVFGLRAVALIACSAVYAAAVDPDEVLRGLRRVSFRSALTATLATRMHGVLSRDAARLAEAQRCRPGDPPPRLAIVRAVAAGALDRAVDVAAALEVRGYGAARRPAAVRRPWSRHDLGFAAAALALLVAGIAARAGGVAEFAAYPRLEAALGAPELALAAGIVALALLPFAERRGIER